MPIPFLDLKAPTAELRHEIDAAVVRRMGAGSWDPVMLREHDLPAPPRP